MSPAPESNPPQADLIELSSARRLRLYLRIARVCRSAGAHGARREAVQQAWDARREYRREIRARARLLVEELRREP